MNNKKRVVVTGLGVVTAIGFDETTLWNNMIAGKTGIKHLSAFDITEYKTPNAAEVNSDDLASALKSRRMIHFDRTVDMTMLASAQALEQAGIISGKPPYEPTDMSTILGTHGTFESVYNTFMSYSEKGPRGIRPSSLPKCIANATASCVSMRFRLTGSNFVITAACSSATTAIGQSYRMIKDGHADKVLCGGCDALFNPVVYGTWDALGVMSRNPDPQNACRPFAADRDGCIIGEGAGALVLESMDSAVQRNASIRAEICGFGESSDATHITSPSAEGQVRAINAAINSAGITPTDIGFINAHGTATKSNDECEAQSIRLALGDAADNIPVASNKSFFGHLLGGSGAVETIVTIIGLEKGKVPSNLNLDNPDPKCNLCFVGNQPMEILSPIAMKNSFGFGGNNAVLILKKWEK
ncbi:beta-ketoacyl-[acyl-carrier-protein] synthase family protein [Verrucomicrobiota bacterium]